MPSYKLTYFNFRGLGEPIRLIFAYAKVDFEDVRVQSTSTGHIISLPQEIKDKCPWSQVPLLEVDGKPLAQSSAIARFLARTFNMVGADDFEAAKCDEYVDTIRDFTIEFKAIYLEKDEEKKVEMLKKFVDDNSKKYLAKFNEIIVANGGGRLVGKNLTWADIYLAYNLSNAEAVFKIDLLSRFPGLQALEEAVFSVPQIKEYIEKRPVTAT